MSQPRIRTLKPENWADESVGVVSREARLLRDVLMTFADDDGRWRHLPSAIIGFGYPYDEDITGAKVKRWAAELADAGLVLLYQRNNLEYGCFPRWHLHQQINKYRPSDLPAPADERVISREQARIEKGKVRDTSGSPTGEVRDGSHPPAQARASGSGSVPSSPVPDPSVDHARAQIDDSRLDETVAILQTCPRLQFDPLLAGVANTLAAHPDVDHKKAAHVTVTNATDPNYRTTDAGKALHYACAQLEREQAKSGPRPFAGATDPTAAPTRWAERAEQWEREDAEQAAKEQVA